MSATSQEIVQRIRTEFRDVLTDLLKTNSAAPTTDTIERNLWQQMLAL